MTDPEPALALRARSTLVDDIAVAVRRRIVSGDLEPGLRIRQQELAEALGVSRTPLREAFQRLEAEGWVRLRARRGAEVRELSAREAEEVFAMRLVLETSAARISSATHGAADEALAATLADPGVQPADGLAGHGDVEEANRRFHELVYGLDDPALPQELRSAVERYWTRALRYRLVYWSEQAAVDRSHSAHVAIFEAWASRDPATTERAVAQHILEALDEITARIDGHRAPSTAFRALAARYGLQ